MIKWWGYSVSIMQFYMGLRNEDTYFIRVEVFALFEEID